MLLGSILYVLLSTEVAESVRATVAPLLAAATSSLSKIAGEGLGGLPSMPAMPSVSMPDGLPELPKSFAVPSLPEGLSLPKEMPSISMPSISMPSLPEGLPELPDLPAGLSTPSSPEASTVAQPDTSASSILEKIDF